MKCPECLKTFKPKRCDQAYCSSACNTKGGIREMKRARRLYRALYGWRNPVNRRKGADREALANDLRFIAREVASWIEEDMLHQRPPPPRHDHTADRGHQRKQLRTPAFDEDMRMQA